MNAEINLSRVVPACETGFFLPGSQNAKVGSCEGQSLFQMLLFQSLEQMSPKEMMNTEETLPDSAEVSTESDEEAQEELAVELADVSGILMKVLTEVPVRASVDIPMMAVKGMTPEAQQEEVPKMTFAEGQGKAPAEISATAMTEVPAKAMTEVPAKAMTEVPAKTMTEMPEKTFTDVSAKAAPETSMETTAVRKKSLEITERELPIQATTGSHDPEIRTTLTKAAEKIEPYNQIGREIQLKLEQKGPMEFKMQLEPKDLGQIEIKLKVNEGKLMIDIMASSSKTHALLAGQVDKLIANMGLQNAEVETVQVELHNGERHSSFQQQPESREREQYFSGTRYKRAETEHTENSPDVRIPRSNFTRMDYTI